MMAWPQRVHACKRWDQHQNSLHFFSVCFSELRATLSEAASRRPCRDMRFRKRCLADALSDRRSDERSPSRPEANFKIACCEVFLTQKSVVSSWKRVSGEL
jgi:hypothetical protein